MRGGGVLWRRRREAAARAGLWGPGRGGRPVLLHLGSQYYIHILLGKLRDILRKADCTTKNHGNTDEEQKLREECTGSRPDTE